MRVELPRTCKGSEILNAFWQAADVERPGIDKWVPEYIEGRTEYDASSLKCIAVKGINALRHVQERKYIFWGELVWREDRGECAQLPAIRLKTIREDLDYNAIDVDISVYISSGLFEAGDWYDASRTSFLAWELDSFRPVFEMIVARMIEILKKASETHSELEAKTKKASPPFMVLPSRINGGS